MAYTLSNENFLVTISSLGAEVLSVKNLKTGEELWWNGDPAYWHGHSPILFPACGGLWDGKYTYNGKEYQMPKHGFVKKMEFTVHGPEEAHNGVTSTDHWYSIDYENTGQKISFVLEGNEETYNYFPFHWRLTITYILLTGTLMCYAKVENLGDETMHYQLGGHPALALPDYPFDNKESITPKTTIGYLRPCCNPSGISSESITIVRAGEQGCCGPERYHLPLLKMGEYELEFGSEKVFIPISIETFHNEALIIDGNQVKNFILYRADAETQLAEVYFNAPACLIWQMQDLLCPYVCIEPWYGLPDRIGCTMPLDYRPYSLHTMPHEESNHFLWGITFYSALEKE